MFSHHNPQVHSFDIKKKRIQIKWNPIHDYNVDKFSSLLTKTLTYLVSVKKSLTFIGEYNPPKQEGPQ